MGQRQETAAGSGLQPRLRDHAKLDRAAITDDGTKTLSGGVLLITAVALVAWACLTAVNGLQERQRFAGFQRVVALVVAGKLHADAGGSIALPSHWRWLTKNGRVYQSRSDTGDVILLFPTDVDEVSVDWGGWVEKKLQAAGYVYSSGGEPAGGWFTFPGMDEVQVVEAEPRRPHWYYAEPFYS